jgi:hypothetical protein
MNGSKQAFNRTNKILVAFNDNAKWAPSGAITPPSNSSNSVLPYDRATAAPIASAAFNKEPTHANVFDKSDDRNIISPKNAGIQSSARVNIGAYALKIKLNKIINPIMKVSK